MARGNIQIVDVAGRNTINTKTFRTEAGATALAVGEPAKLKAAGSEYVIPLADAEPVIGTTTKVVGIVASPSTHTASADGSVEVYMPIPGMVYRAAAKSAAAVDTDAELAALLNTNVLLDLTSGVYTVDTATVAAAANGVTIVGGNISAGTVDFIIRDSATLYGDSVIA